VLLPPGLLQLRLLWVCAWYVNWDLICYFLWPFKVLTQVLTIRDPCRVIQFCVRSQRQLQVALQRRDPHQLRLRQVYMWYASWSKLSSIIFEVIIVHDLTRCDVMVLIMCALDPHLRSQRQLRVALQSRDLHHFQRR
jgi:hypothetical protein